MGLHPEALYWSQDFWGGSVALLGGALVIGAAARILKKPKAWDAILMGIGIAILANTRPFEGVLLVVPVLAWMGIEWLRKEQNQRSLWIKTILVPLGICAFCVAGWMGYYNWRVTGNPLRMPYMVHESQYAMAPVFLFQKARPEPVYPFPEIRALHAVQEMERYTHGRAGILAYAKEKFTSLGNRFQQDTALALPLIVLPWVIRRDRRLRLAAVLLLICGAGVVIETFIQSHYLAPQLGALVLLLVGSMRWLNCWQRRQRLGQVLLWSVLLISAFGYVNAYAKMAHPDAGDRQFKVPRAEIIERLDRTPGEHLVLIRDLPDRGLAEWVDNQADIDHAKIVWAHDMGPADNAELLTYFSNRHVWLLEVGQGPGPLEPYPTDQTMPTTSTTESTR